MEFADPAIVDVKASLDSVKTRLLALGATSPDRRSVAYVIDEHLLLLDYDGVDACTTIAVGGPRANAMAQWLVLELDDGAGHARLLLPARDPHGAAPMPPAEVAALPAAG